MVRDVKDLGNPASCEHEPIWILEQHLVLSAVQGSNDSLFSVPPSTAGACSLLALLVSQYSLSCKVLLIIRTPIVLLPLAKAWMMADGLLTMVVSQSEGMNKTMVLEPTSFFTGHCAFEGSHHISCICLTFKCFIYLGKSLWNFLNNPSILLKI